MQAVVTAPRAAQTHNLHRAGGRFGVAFVLVRLRALDTAGVLGRTSSLFRAALVAMSGLGEQWNRKYGRRLDLGPPE